MAAKCKEYRIESITKQEDAVVKSMNYTSGYNRLELVWNFYNGKFELQNVYHPEKNIIAFDGEIDFEVDNRMIFGRFKRIGELADVSYKEIHWKTYDYDGETRYIKEDLIEGYKFVDAQPKVE